MTAEPIISLIDVRVTFDGADRPSLSGVDLDIGEGEFVGIVGANGSGKTTLGLLLDSIIPQLIPATITGRVVVAGRDIARVPVHDLAGTVGIVLDDPGHQLSQATVADEVALGLESLGLPPASMPGRIAAALATVGLSGLEERSPMALSGGQQQLLAIAAALVMEPRILVMDEPTSYLDPVTTTEIFEIAHRLNRDTGITIVIAEHEVEALARYADRIVVLHAGRVVLTGSPASVFAQVDALAAIGIRPPQVTAVAHALDPEAVELPVTVEGALAWFGGRS